MISENTRFLIVGLGLIGGSYARALKAKGYAVDGLDADPKAVEYALANRFIDNGSSENDETVIKAADIIILALYPQAEIAWIRDNQHKIREQTLITDATGVKAIVVDRIEEFLREDLRFVPAHPMAGREVSGGENSRADLFAGANYIVVETDKSTEADLMTVEQIGKLLGAGSISRLSVSEHDEMVGFLSQLTHVIAISLMTCNDDGNMEKYTGDSFRDLTRIARINEKMWSELFLANRQTLMDQIDSFADKLNEIRSYIENEDREALEDVMRRSTARRRQFEGK